MFIEIFSIGCLVAVVFFFCKECCASLFSGGGSAVHCEEDWLIKAHMKQQEDNRKRLESLDKAGLEDFKRRAEEMKKKWG